MTTPTIFDPSSHAGPGLAAPSRPVGEPATCVVGPGDLFADHTPPARASGQPFVPGYELLEMIGSGGMGVVLKARHIRLNRTVALKLLGRDALADPNSRQRFQIEAEAVARLQHPNIIQVFDVGTFEQRPGDAERTPYLSLEYVDGGSMYRLTYAPQPPAHAARLVEKLARGVHAAHQVGVIHRDLKPANVLLTRDGEPKIADFGLAKPREPARDPRGRYLTQLGAAVGTPEYMAPEQVDGVPATPAFDIYALGVILYELLTARVPFKGLTITETMLLVKFQEPVPPRRLQPNLPRDLETICLKCMAKSADARYPTAAALADDLARWLDGQPIHARPVSGVERVGRWAKRNPTLAALSAVAVGLAAAGVGGVTWKWRDAEWHAQQAEAKAREAEEQTLAARWELYRSNIAIASIGLKLNTLNSTRDALARASEEHRNWEWRYYTRQMDSARRVISVPGGQLVSAITQQRGRVLFTQSDLSTLWDVDGGRAVHEFTHDDLPAGWLVCKNGRQYCTMRDGGEMVVRSLAGGGEVVLSCPGVVLWYSQFSDDGRFLLTHADDQTPRVWDTATGRVVAALGGHCGVVGTVGLSDDGRLAATHDMSSDTMFVWDVAAGERLFDLPGLSNLFDVRFSPDGKRLLVNEAYPSSKIRMYDTANGRQVAVLDRHKNNVKDYTFSPDGRRMATASADQTVCVWEVDSGRHLATLRGHNGLVTSVRFSPDGKRLVSGSDDMTARLWEVDTGLELAVLRGHTRGVAAVAFTADGNEVMSVGRDNGVRYWDARAAAENGVFRGHTSFVYQAVYHPDGRHVLSAAWDGTARAWDTTTGKQVRVFDHPGGKALHAVAVHPNGLWVATLTRNSGLHLWDFHTGELLHTWAVPSDHYKTGRLAFHPTAPVLACGCIDGTVRVFDAERRVQVAEVTGHTDSILELAFTADGRWLASGAADADKRVCVWDTATWEPVRHLSGHTDAVHSLAFSHDGRTLASGSADGSVRLWDTDTWEETGKLPHGVKVYGLAFSHDGKRLVSGCADNTIRLWDVKRREEVAELRGHTDYVHSVAFSPDGHKLVSASGDLTVRIWDATPISDRPPEE